MIAVDASALIAFFLREEGWENLAKYLVRVVSIDHVVKEFYNAVWKATLLQKRITRDEAHTIIKLFQAYLEKNLELRNELRYLDTALEIAMEKRITVYDALYIALALEEGLPLLTLDEKQRQTAKSYGVKVLP